MRRFEIDDEGFTYVALLLAIVFFGLGSVGVARVLASSERGEKERELLFVGQQFRNAIGAYYTSGPGVSRYPETLEQLLADPRFPTLIRHLRRIYPDPVTGQSEWGLVMAPEGGIMGVYSLSEREPMKRANFEPPNQVLNEAAAMAETREGLSYSYRDWRFVYPAANTVSGVTRAVAKVK